MRHICGLRQMPTGRERPPKLFGRLEAEQLGSLPPISVYFLPALFKRVPMEILAKALACIASLVKNLVKTKVKNAILTFFTSII